ncbi:MAG: tRNA (guanine(46)-N(7))-methyltransferase TrmB [Hyphomicrobiaceae bacterium]
MAADGRSDDGATGRRRRKGPPPGPARQFFGRMRGHRLSPAVETAFAAALPRYGLDLSRSPPSSLAGLFPRPVRDAWLEIGFGMGEHLIHRAAADPGIGFLGAEPFVNGFAATVVALAEAGLDNVRLHDREAAPLLEWLPDGALGRVYVLFPDPWPKARHRKRRLVSPVTLRRLARVMRPGAELRVATDIGDYVRTTLEAVGRSGDFRWRADGPADWRTRWPDWPETKYERKAIAAGRTRYFLTFERC